MRGHIVRRGESWSVVIDLPRGPDGKRRQKWHTVRGSKADAERALRRLLRDLDEGTWRDDRVTVAEFAGDWLDVVSRSLAASTVKSYTGHLELHVLPVIGDRKLVQVTGQSLSQLYASIDRSPATVQRVHATVRKMLGDAMRWDLLARNPAVLAVLPRGGDRREAISVWTPAEMATFFAAARASRWWPMWAFLATTGVRRCEALGLTWDDVDLEADVVLIRRQRRPDGVTMLKTSSSRRAIAISPELSTVLREWRQTVVQERLLVGEAWIDDGWVYVWPTGQGPHPDSVSKWFRAMANELGLPPIRLHDLRHTHATDLLRQGFDAKVVADRLGHSSTVLTRDTYQHLVPELDRRAAAAAGAALRTGADQDRARMPST